MININQLPIIGWALSLFFNICLAVPFWIFWTCCGIGEKYFYFLPEVYKSIPFWQTVALFICIGIVGSIIKTLSPFNITNTATGSN